ncbi:hypothetical protein XI06_14105 [Bradyrhizobium sp. CCBAU 11434]|uniref:hypothetical protein n=1 Tax=Bradyrhizobium sp. CCBAU 11434 TaxID=1630885 RepID=UPI002306C45B|nr:hypothetical protein [Bradyrhizobium sp. CCBAU 11434]MDA9521456.1 hypothetical protein [Bradyrhizobium sp. CCBAU 11434]
MARYEAARQRELARLDAEPDCALRSLIDSLPKRSIGLREPARVMLAEKLRDIADLVERGEVEIDRGAV